MRVYIWWKIVLIMKYEESDFKISREDMYEQAYEFNMKDFNELVSNMDVGATLNFGQLFGEYEIIDACERTELIIETEVTKNGMHFTENGEMICVGKITKHWANQLQNDILNICCVENISDFQELAEEYVRIFGFIENPSEN